jgi:hypothetical protein
MTRRSLLQGILAAGLWNAWAGRGEAAQPKAKDMKSITELQKNWRIYLAEGFKAPLPSEPLNLSKEEWRKRLSPAAYSVLREEGTERAGSSPLNGEKREGVFVCSGCDPAALHLGDEVRERHRLAELLHDDTGGVRHEKGLRPVPAAHRVPLHPLRGAPRPRLRRRPAAHRPAVVQ